MRYIISQDDMEVTDSITKLVWKTEVTYHTFDEAIKYASASAESTGIPWRVPRLDELYSLVDVAYARPCSTFPGIEADWFWSSSPYVGNTKCAWSVDCYFGSVHFVFRTYKHAVRLVRKVKPGLPC